MGLWRGKKGSSVFYYLRNSNNREKQGIREYQPVVANPQTAAQISQRVYLRPAQNIYRELADIIRRSWQGLEYGGKGTQEFFKGALRHGSTLPVGIPWLNKGDQRAVPGAYKISNGSLQEVVVTSIDTDEVYTSLNCSRDVGTWGEASESLIAGNSLKEGDQLTLVICASDTEEPTANARFGWEVVSLYVNTSSTETLEEITANWRFVELATSANGKLVLLNKGGVPFPFLQAAAVIVSRLGNTGNYLRSPSTIAVNEQGMAYFYSPTRYLEARNSYRIWGGSTRSGNWVVDENAGDAPASRETIDGTYTLNGLTGEKASANGINVRVQRYADDNALAAVYLVPVEDSGTTIYPLINNASGQAVQWTGTGGAFGYILPADQPELANLQKIIQG